MFGVEREVALHNPSVVAGVFLQYFLHGFALVFAKVYQFCAVLVIDEASGKVYVVAYLGVVSQELYVILQVFWVFV